MCVIIYIITTSYKVSINIIPKIGIIEISNKWIIIKNKTFLKIRYLI